MKQLGECDYPKEQHCHVRIRAGAVSAEQGSEVARLLDFGSASLDESREAALRSMLTQLVLPFLANAATLDGLRQLLASGTLKNAFVRGNARAILE
jgi:hypothetical protein